MKRLGLFICTAVAVLAGACAPPPPPPPPDTTAADTAAINKLRSDYEAAWKAGDADKLGSLVTSDVVSYPANEPTVSGRAAFVESQKKSFSETTPNMFTIKSEEMRLMGGMAFDRGTVDIAFTPKMPKAKPVEVQSRYIVILRREPDGTWRLVRGIDNTAAAMPPMPAPPVKK